MVSRSVIGIVSVVVIIIAVGAYYMSTTSKVPMTTSPTKITTQSQLFDGTKLYTDNCAPCHGAKGIGGTAVALTASNANRSVIEKGNIDKGMPAFEGKLTADEITAILGYLTS